MGTLFQVYERVCNSLDEVYQRVRKSIIYLEEPLLKCFKKTRIMAISLKCINITSWHGNDKHTTCFSDLFFFNRLVKAVSFFSGRNTKGARGRISGRSLPTRFTELCVCDLDFSELFHSMWLKTRRKKTLIVRTKFCDLLARCFEVLKVFATDLLMQLEPFQRF